jgi:cobalt transporter subunit CbtA
MSLSSAATGVGGGAFNLIVRTAAAAGIVAGLLLTGVQHVQVTSIIQQAEVYETSAKAAAPQAAPEAHAHADGGPEQHEHKEKHEHEHEHGGWQPEDGVERTFYTALADVSMAVGYGLLLAAFICLRGKSMDWRKGLMWGVAAYAVFFLAPSLGLPPELPGTAAAPVAARQGWWIATAMSTATALALLAFGRHWVFKLAAIALLIVPHLAGAPQPLVHASAAPEELARSFIYATALANGIFWLALGALTGYFYKRFSGAAAI